MTEQVNEKKVVKIVVSTTNYPMRGDESNWLISLMVHAVKDLKEQAGSKSSVSFLMSTDQYFPIMDEEDALRGLQANKENYYLCRDPYGQIPRHSEIDRHTLCLSIRSDEFKPGSAKEKFDTGILMTLFMNAIQKFDMLNKDGEVPKLRMDAASENALGLMTDEVVGHLQMFLADNDIVLEFIREKLTVV